jgi:uncharacterized membrane protein YbjE (DUF340 family)
LFYNFFAMDVVWVLAFFVGGLAAGRALRGKSQVKTWSERIMSIAVFILLFFLGVGVGRNTELLQRLPLLGGRALVLALGALLGTVVLLALAAPWLKKGKEGRGK